MREAGVDLIIQRAASDRNWRPVNRCTCSQINVKETEHCHRAKTVDKWCGMFGLLSAWEGSNTSLKKSVAISKK